MDPLVEAIVTAGAARGESPDVARRHHLLEGLLRRLSGSPHVEDLVLRGGLMTRVWAPGRVTRDLDLAGDFPFSVHGATEALRVAFLATVDDGATVIPDRFRASGIWLDSGFPGVRASVTLRFGGVEEMVTADVGFGDPLVPPPTVIPYPALLAVPAARVRAVRPETQVAWKLHGLAEFGSSFRPKDLADLHRITGAMPLDVDLLADALRAAFTSRGFPLSAAVEVLDHPDFRTKSARVRFDRGGYPLALEDTLHTVRTRLGPALERLQTREP